MGEEGLLTQKCVQSSHNREQFEPRSIVSEFKLTTVMVTHSMAQALQYGDRTLMFHRGQIVFDVSGDERRSMGVADLLALFKQGEDLSDDALLLD